MKIIKSSRQAETPLFSFVIVADTHVNEHDEVTTSPFLTNGLANGRARHVFQQIAAMDPPPRFVMHLGDIVHPVPALPTFHDAVARFREIAAPVQLPLHLVPGNHDVGDKCVDWMPADQVSDDYLALYRDVFGADFYAFEEGGLRCLVLNSLLLNSGLADEPRQQAWLEAQITEAEAAGQRVFLFMHYPPYLHRPDERGNYDNVDEPARTWLLAQMARPAVEAVFAGHVHNFWYDRVGTADFYMLPSTAFLRHDFSEFYRVAPQTEFGRGDADKFGYFVVDVFANGHVAYAVRTQGVVAQRDEPSAQPQLRLLAHPQTSDFHGVGVELRHPWTEAMQITATGGVQEFGRKWARNDYPLLALWEMGVRLAKVPEVDLLDADCRARMKLMAPKGVNYLVTTLGAPKSALLDTPLRDCGVSGFEVNATFANFEKQRDRLRTLRATTGAQIWYAKILSYEHAQYDGKTFSHYVKSGFGTGELAEYGERLAAAREAGEIDGVTVRVASHESLCEAAATAAAFANRSGCGVLLSLKLAGDSLARERADDRANVERVAHAMILSKVFPRLRFVFDTFMDVDRGYFPRHAFIDRRFTPRAPALAYTMLSALLSNTGAITLQTPLTDARTSLRFKAGGTHYWLACGNTDTVRAVLAGVPDDAAVFDLCGGDGAAPQAAAAVRATLDAPSLWPRHEVMLVRL